jgi:pyruvate formate lyase activating enzyme
VRESLGPNTPWHVLPGDAGAAAAATVARARRLGHEAGLHYVYGPEPGQTTRCHQCGHTLIERGAASGRVVGITDGRCHSCGADPQMRLSIFKR